MSGYIRVYPGISRCIQVYPGASRCISVHQCISGCSDVYQVQVQQKNLNLMSDLKHLFENKPEQKVFTRKSIYSKVYLLEK